MRSLVLMALGLAGVGGCAKTGVTTNPAESPVGQSDSVVEATDESTSEVEASLTWQGLVLGSEKIAYQALPEESFEPSDYAHWDLAGEWTLKTFDDPPYEETVRFSVVAGHVVMHHFTDFRGAMAADNPNILVLVDQHDMYGTTLFYNLFRTESGLEGAFLSLGDGENPPYRVVLMKE